MCLMGERAGVSIGQTVVSAIGWSTGIKVGFQLLTWAMTLLVVRILSPDDYGLMALSQIVVNILLAFSHVGLGDALIQRESTPRPVVAAVFGLLLLLSAVLTTGVALAAYPIAAWYHEPRLAPLIQVASLGFLFAGVNTLPRVFLTKSLRIRPMFIMELSSGVVGAATIVILAYSGYGVWALVLGGLVNQVVRLAGFIVLTSEYFVWPTLDLALVRPLLPFGVYRTLEHLLWVCFTSVDAVIIGWRLGAAELGFYTVALNLAALPLSKVAPIINQVAFPAFALIQHDPAEARRYVGKAMRLMTMVAVPVFFGMSAVAPELVALVFGPTWTATAPLLAVLALAMSLRAIMLVVPNYLQGIGQAKASFWCNLASAAVFTPLFLIGCQWGVLGVCYAWLLGYPPVFVATVLIAARYGRLDPAPLLLTPLRPMLAGALMVVAVAALRPWLVGGAVQTLTVLVLAGAAVYGGVMVAAFRPLVRELVGVVYRRGRVVGV